MDTNPTSSKTDRNTMERNRRIQMRALFNQLNSLIPHPTTSSREAASSMPDQLHAAENYIKKLKEKVGRMKEKKASLLGREGSEAAGATPRKPPHIEIQEMGSCGGLMLLLIVITTGLDCHQFLFYAILRVLSQGGAEIMNASYSVLGDKALHTIHLKVAEHSHYGSSVMSESLMKLVQDAHIEAHSKHNA